MAIDYSKLKEPMVFSWKVQTANDYGCSCVAYIDSRQVQDKLDDVVGPMNWKSRYYTVGTGSNEQLFCEISIYDEDKREWISKADTGTESMTEKEKGLVSDAFKRAAVHFGVGRFLYSLEIQKLKTIKGKNGKPAPADDNGNQIWDVTKHINDMLGKKGGRSSNASNAVKSANASKEAKDSTPTPVTSTPTDGHVPTAGRYNADKGGADVQYQKAHNFSETTIKRVSTLERDGLKGKAVLTKYVPLFNLTNGTAYENVSSFNSDELMLSLIEFIENTPPSGM